MWSGTKWRRPLTLHDAILCIHLDVCRIRCYGDFFVYLGRFVIFNTQDCDATNDGFFGHHVFSYGLCLIPIREKGNLVDFNFLINIKYLDRGPIGEGPC